MIDITLPLTLPEKFRFRKFVHRQVALAYLKVWADAGYVVVWSGASAVVERAAP